MSPRDQHTGLGRGRKLPGQRRAGPSQVRSSKRGQDGDWAVPWFSSWTWKGQCGSGHSPIRKAASPSRLWSREPTWVEPSASAGGQRNSGPWNARAIIRNCLQPNHLQRHVLALSVAAAPVRLSAK